jgi:UDP:flavonoid glycosyltransferase YjiC (YdhE family)
MKIVIVCVGSRGDVQPYAALAAGLRKAGYEVTIGTHSEFRELVSSTGAHFSVIEGNPREMLQTEEGRQWLESDKNPLGFFAGLIRLSRAFFQDLTRDITKTCSNAEAIIYSPLALCAHSVAEKMKVPSCMAPLQPVSPTRLFASPMFPQIRLGESYNMLTHRMSRQMIWQPFRRMFNQWRQEVLNLPPYSFWGPLDAIHRNNDPVIHAISPVIVPKPADWRRRSYITGYWFLNEGRNWKPPDDLLRFLSAGKPPVYIGFGSMSERDPKRLSELLIKALMLSKRRGILLSGWAQIPRENLPEEVIVVDSVPHDWLFPKMAAVVHHGGAGTTAAVFRAGVPNVVIPFFGDQHFWASRVYDLGTGPEPIPRKKLTAENLADAINRALSDQNIRNRASQIGHRVNNESGVQRAIDILQNDVFSHFALASLR